MAGPCIGIDYTPALLQTGGIGRYIRELVRALAVSDQQTDYRLFTAERRLSALPPPPGPNFTWKPTPITDQWLLRIWHKARIPLPIQAFTGRIDLLHAPSFYLPPVLPGTRTLLTVHDLSYEHLPWTLPASLVAYLKRVTPQAAARADHILADSEATRQDLITLYNVPAEKVSVLYLGVDAAFQPVTDAAHLQAMRQRCGIGDGPYLLSVGTIQPRKNYIRLIEAFARLNRPGLKLVIMGGNGWLNEPIYARAAKLGLEGRVIIGFADDADLPALYSGAEVFVFPSLYEGFGLPPLEAMACGTPVISSATSSLPEVIGEAGVLIDPLDVDGLAEAITRVLDDSTLRQSLIARGFAQAQRFRWQDAAAQLTGHYQRLLGTQTAG